MFALTEQKRIERLTGLAKVWGTVKFYHPYLANQNINWDKSLVETITKVNSAKTSQEYQAAINSMLAALNDKTTVAEIKNVSKIKTQNDKKQGEPGRLITGMLVLDLAAITEMLVADCSQKEKIYKQIEELSRQAKAVIYDCRLNQNIKVSDDAFGYYFNEFLRETLSNFLLDDISKATYRYRMHNGYTPQSGQPSGGYYSSLVTDAPEMLTGSAATKLPLGFIINDNTPEFSDILSSLQSAKLAYIVQEGELTKEFGANAFEISLPDSVSVKMRTTELVNTDGTLGFQSDLIVKKSANEDSALKEIIFALKESKPNAVRYNKVSANAPQRGLKEDSYKEMEFPNPEYRLLALFRFWSVIDNFYPYKNLITDTWKDVLPRYIPKFEADKNAVDYQMTVSEMVTEIHDSHGFIQGTRALSERLGNFTVPFLVRYINNQAVVFYILDDKIPVKIGDVLVAVDGEPETKRRVYLSHFIAASTPQKLNFAVAMGILRGQKDSKAKITLKAVDGKTREVEIARTETLYNPNLYKAFFRTTPEVEILPGGFGYVDLGRLQIGEVDEMFEIIKDTKAVIFDMRGYPNATAWSIAPRLTDKSNVSAALFSRPILSAKNLGPSDFANGTNYSFIQQIPERVGEVYRGKVVMLIDEWAISQAEHTCLFFESAANVTFIGMPTAGANGDVTNLVLPGAIYVTFSGHEVRHADGRQLQRIGIQPMIKVSPTIKGIAQKRDEILEAAIKFLQMKEKIK
ncbi:MAG: S41 family peptidase [Actinomycetota bacterium]